MRGGVARVPAAQESGHSCGAAVGTHSRRALTAEAFSHLVSQLVLHTLARGRGRGRRGLAEPLLHTAGRTCTAASMANKRASSAPNPLRAAHDSRKRSKASELWFRKCNHGEALFRVPRGAVGRAGGGGRGVLGGAAPAAADHVVGAPARARRVCAPAARVGARGAGAVGGGRRRVAGVIGAARAGRGRRGGGAGCAARRGRRRRRAQPAGGGVDAAGARAPRGAGQPLPRRVRVAGLEDAALLAAVAGGASEARRVGMVVANDAHPQRVAALLDALGRHGRSASELARLVVTCHRGEALPAPARPFGKRRGGGIC